MPAPVPPRRRRHSIRRFIRVYHHRLARDPRRERLFLATLAFLLTFVFIRGLTYSIRYNGYNVEPFHDVSVGGTHVHHLVWGILLLLAVGYVALVEFGTRGPISNLVTRLGAIAFGVGGADAGRVRPLPQPPGRLLGKGGPPQHRRRPHLRRHPEVGVFGKDLIRGLAHEARAIVTGIEWARWPHWTNSTALSDGTPTPRPARAAAPQATAPIARRSRSTAPPRPYFFFSSAIRLASPESARSLPSGRSSGIVATGSTTLMARWM
jgi:hypothetical protein